MNIKEMQDEIMRIKKEKDICILAHAYQSHDIWEVADYVGDSFGLAQRAAEAPQKTMIMCGVRFMAETVKLLSPEKTVYLPEPDAGCPMADQIDYDLLAALREKNPDYTVVAYVNTTTEVKTLSDVCVTSSSAVKIVKNMPEKDILFIPDCNPGSWVKKQVPEKNIKLVSGGCPTHSCCCLKKRCDFLMMIPINATLIGRMIIAIIVISGLIVSIMINTPITVDTEVISCVIL